MPLSPVAKWKVRCGKPVSTEWVMDNNAIRSLSCTAVFSFDVTERGKNLLNRDKKLAFIWLAVTFYNVVLIRVLSVILSRKKKEWTFRNCVYSIYVLATLGNGLALVLLQSVVAIEWSQHNTYVIDVFATLLTYARDTLFCLNVFYHSRYLFKRSKIFFCVYFSYNTVILQ